MIIYNSFYSEGVNECLTNNGGCAQVCTDTLVSFVCSCNEGFTLASNNFDCIGKKVHILNTLKMIRTGTIVTGLMLK